MIMHLFTKSKPKCRIKKQINKKTHDVKPAEVLSHDLFSFLNKMLLFVKSFFNNVVKDYLSREILYSWDHELSATELWINIVDYTRLRKAHFLTNLYVLNRAVV